MLEQGVGRGTGEGIGSWPRRRARKTPGRTAVVHGDDTQTYRELDETVTRFARALRARGIGRGDRVAYLGPNHPAFLHALFATCAVGAVFVPLNTRLAASELAYMLNDSGARLLLHDPRCAQTALQAGAGIAVAVDGLADDRADDCADDRADEVMAADDPCMIMYTSGTTGHPKGAVLSHANITWNSLNVLVDTDLASDEITLVTAPLFHTAALNMTCLPTLLKGGRVVIEPGFEAERMLDLIESQGVTCLFGVPTMFAAVAESPRWESADLSSVRILMCGGSPVPKVLIDTYLRRGLSFIQGYGMTEASPGTLLLDREMSAVKAGSAGVPHFFTDVRLVRSDLTGEADVGEPGEILVHGPHVMRGYYGLPDATADALLAGGWFRSGDVGVRDEDGYVSIVDRVKDMIISGGENVYPAEVENVLYDHPDVAECAVIGMPDARWGEVGKAVVVLRTGASTDPQGLLDHLASRLAKYKVPKAVEFRTALPRTASGKIRKSALR
ncbi:long-chain fatty acid--CoA ligase [Streptomyces sp. NPDC005962]|uniref:acyl-CoA synthetase n=1 Tax=Streptomyces sp. NPDC005962 TaxID=3154466 RepID=UPI0034053EC9